MRTPEWDWKSRFRAPTLDERKGKARRTRELRIDPNEFEMTKVEKRPFMIIEFGGHYMLASSVMDEDDVLVKELVGRFLSDREAELQARRLADACREIELDSKREYRKAHKKKRNKEPIEESHRAGKSVRRLPKGYGPSRVEKPDGGYQADRA